MEGGFGAARPPGESQAAVVPPGELPLRDNLPKLFPARRAWGPLTGGRCGVRLSPLPALPGGGAVSRSRGLREGHAGTLWFFSPSQWGS